MKIRVDGLNTGPSATAVSASEVLKEEHPSGVSFSIADGTLDGDSGVVSGITIPSRTSANSETEDYDVMIVATTPAPDCQALADSYITINQRYQTSGDCSEDCLPSHSKEQAEAVSTIQSTMDLEDQGKDPNTVTESVTSTPILASTATATSRDTLAMKLKLSEKELKHLQ